MKIWFLAIALPVAVLLSIGAATRDYFAVDLFLARAVQEVRFAPWEETLELVSFLGKGVHVAAIVLALLAWSLWKRRRAECFAFGGALLSLGLNPMLKVVVDRPRPSEELITVWESQGGQGFPSGHAFGAVVLLGLLYYLAPLLLPGRRTVLVVRISLLLLVLLVGLSRVYLGAHWPSDVLGGFLFGGIVLVLLTHLHRLQSPLGKVP